MKFKLLFFLLFSLIVAPIRAEVVPTNAPTQDYLVYEGKIYTFATGSTYDYDTTCFSCATYEGAQDFVAAWYEWLAYYDTLGLPSVYEPGKPDTSFRPNLSSWYPNPLSDLVIVPRYSGSEVVSYYVVWSVREHGTNTSGSSRLFKGAMAGLNTQWHATATPFNAFCVARGVSFNSVPDNGGAHWVYYADAEYAEEPEPQEPTPEGLSDGVFAFYDGQWVYTEYSEPFGAVCVFSGPSLYADTKEDAEKCASSFAEFLASYSWPSGRPAVLPWSEPKVYKCFVVYNGQVTRVFWRVFFQNWEAWSADQRDDYFQCLEDYTLISDGTGGQGVVGFYVVSGTASASNSGSAQLNGNQLAQSDSGTSSVKLTSGGRDVNVAQYTVQKVDAEGDTVGTSEVTSEASVSEGSDGSINVTNNTTITTNLELGDAPAADFFTTEERQVSSSSDLLTETEPEYSYIVKGGSEDYSIDFETFFEDVKKKISEIFGMEELLAFFQDGVSTSATLEDWQVSISPSLSFTVPWSTLASHSVVQTARGALSLFMQLMTLLMCFKIMA